MARQIAAASLLEMLLASVPAHEFLARSSPLHPDPAAQPQLSLVRLLLPRHASPCERMRMDAAHFVASPL